MGAADAGLLGHLEGRGALAADFRPAQQEDLAPAGLRAKAQANLAALEVLAALRAEGRPADPAEQAALARWSGWGALPGVFDERDTTWSTLRAELRRHLDGRAWDAARRTVLNAHYSPAEVAGAIWTAVTELAFTGGRVLEPGCGSGNFIGLAPEDVAVEMVGVELDPTTAAIAQALYPTATIRAEGFETSRFPGGFFDLTVGNVQGEPPGIVFRIVHHSTSPQPVGSFAGFPLEVTVRQDASGPFLAIGLADTPIQLLLTPSDLAQADAQGLVSRLEHRLRSLEDTRDNALADRDSSARKPPPLAGC